MNRIALTEVARESQIAVLGSMLVDPDCVGEVLLRLRDEDFLEAPYRLAFQAIRRLFNEGRPTDPLSVNDALGGEYRQMLADCIDLTPTAANVAEWVDILRRRAAQFRLAELGERLAEAEDLDAAQALVDEINGACVQKTGVKITTMEAAYSAFCDRQSEERQPPYLTWGIPFLDERIHIEPGDFVVLGGYPSAGKTALALQLVRHIAGSKRVGYFYLENNDHKLFDRLVSSTALVPFGRIKTRTLTEEDFRDIVGAQERLVGARLELVAASGMTVADVRATALKRHYDLIVVDYLQKLRGGRTGRDLTSFERVSRVSSALQELGQETGITVLALSQLSRPEKSEGKAMAAPTMASLRESGQIEQDADVVLLVYRADTADPIPRTLKIAKNKEGEAGLTQSYDFDGETQTFRRSAAGYVEPPPPRPRQKARQVSFWADGSELTKVPADGAEPF